MACMKCGNQLNKNSKFCVVCGAPATKVAQTPLSFVNIKVIIGTIAAVAVIGVGILVFSLSNRNYSGTEIPYEPVETVAQDTADDTYNGYEAQDEEEFDVEPQERQEPEHATHVNGAIAALEFLSAYTTLFYDGSPAYYLASLIGFDTKAPDFNIWDTIAGDHSRFLLPDTWEPNPDLIPQFVIDYPSFQGLHSAAGYFALFDVHGNGIPLIGIYYFTMFANGQMPIHLFNFVDGEYVEIGEIWLPMYPADLFIDQDGNLIAVVGEWWSPPAVYNLLIQDNALFKSLVRQMPHDLWETTWDMETYLLPDMPFADLTSTRMTDLETDIRNRLTPVMHTRVADAIANPSPPMQGLLALEDEAARAGNLAFEALPAHLWPPMTSPGISGFDSGLGFVIYGSDMTDFFTMVSLDMFTNRPICVASARWLQGLSSAELRIARNEIFARHGRRFADPALQAYFDAQPWYTPILPLGTDPVLSQVERSNVDILSYLEQGGDLWNPTRAFVPPN